MRSFLLKMISYPQLLYYSLDWRDRVTLGAGPTFLHVKTHWLGWEGQLGIHRALASMFYAIKQHGGEYEDVNSTSEKMVLNFSRLFTASQARGPVLTRGNFFPCKRAVKLPRGRGCHRGKFFSCKQGLSVSWSYSAFSHVCCARLWNLSNLSTLLRQFRT